MKAANSQTSWKRSDWNNFPGRHLSYITMPRFFAHSGDDRSWSASADKGRTDEKVDRLLLRKNVVLIHDQSGTRMKTQALDIELENKSGKLKQKSDRSSGQQFDKSRRHGSKNGR